MKTTKLDYILPQELIAQKPAEKRTDSRLLICNKNTGEVKNEVFKHITNYLKPGDCLILNDTKVLAARFYGQKHTEGKLEGLFLKANPDGSWTVMLKGLRKVKINEEFIIHCRDKNEQYNAVLMEKTDEGQCKIKIKQAKDVKAVLEDIGYPPLPPYIKRNENPEMARLDKKRYQTVYAEKTGAVAAPTAGLHFSKELIELLKKNGIKIAYVTLHVGSGTFKPVTVDDLTEHKIHSEKFELNQENANIINQAKNAGGRIIAVGTTAVRSIETIAKNNKVEAAAGQTELFIMPGYKFKMIDAVITNFHLPKSTLLALVAAFMGMENMKAAYQFAIDEKYRFYSYGDSMFII